MYDHLLSGGILWKPQVGLYPGGNMGATLDPLLHCLVLSCSVLLVSTGMRSQSIIPTSLTNPNGCVSHRRHADRMYEFMQSDQIIPGFGDGGAHASIIQDAVGATHSLTQWVRDRTRGEKFPIEVIVKKQSADVAELFGLTDRGRLTVGMKADLNCFDLETLKVHQPYMMTDTGPGVELERWTQTVEGYKLTVVAGVPTFRDGQSTGAFPGTLARNPARDESTFQNIAWEVSAEFDGYVPEFVDNSDKLEGFGDKGGSAAARLLREAIENGETAKL